jgi:hypothetical protein
MQVNSLQASATETRLNVRSAHLSAGFNQTHCYRFTVQLTPSGDCPHFHYTVLNNKMAHTCNCEAHDIPCMGLAVGSQMTVRLSALRGDRALPP